jgi:hypothetical protein
MASIKWGIRMRDQEKPERQSANTSAVQHLGAVPGPPDPLKPVAPGHCGGSTPPAPSPTHPHAVAFPHLHPVIAAAAVAVAAGAEAATQ